MSKSVVEFVGKWLEERNLSESTKKVTVKEGVEQEEESIQELDRSTLYSYHKKASKDYYKQLKKSSEAPSDEESDAAREKAQKRLAGASRAHEKALDIVKKTAEAKRLAKIAESVELEEATTEKPHVLVSVHGGAGGKYEYEVVEQTPKSSPRGKIKNKTISQHTSAEEATAAADEHARKNGLHRLR